MNQDAGRPPAGGLPAISREAFLLQPPMYLLSGVDTVVANRNSRPLCDDLRQSVLVLQRRALGEMHEHPFGTSPIHEGDHTGSATWTGDGIDHSDAGR